MMNKKNNVHKFPASFNPAPVNRSSKLWCFFGVHSYEIKSEGPMRYHSDGVTTRVLRYYDLRCSCCGKMKTRIL